MPAITEFVAFHVDPDGGGRESDGVRLLRLMVRSAKLGSPGATCVLLTDGGFDASRIPLDSVVRFDVDRRSLMLERMRLQVRYLSEAGTRDRNYVLIDSDVLLNGALDVVFAGQFAVGLTVRDSVDMPVNGGVIFIRGADLGLATSFLSRALALYETKYAGEAGWWGDQLALRDAMHEWGSEHPQALKLFPCDQYNFSPSYQRLYRSALAPYPATILHFKGERKHLMELYWRRHLSRDPGIRERVATVAAGAEICGRAAYEAVGELSARVRGAIRARVERLRAAN